MKYVMSWTDALTFHHDLPYIPPLYTYCEEKKISLATAGDGTPAVRSVTRRYAYWAITTLLILLTEGSELLGNILH
jgi:hypothetical protein